MTKLLLTTTLLVLGISAFAFSATYGGGAGTPGNPYLIYTPLHFNTIGANPADWSASFKLMADISMSAYAGTQYNIIGTATTNFSGSFDGNCHTISRLTYTGAAPGYAALFAYTSASAAITDLRLTDAKISGSSYTAALVGQNLGTVSRCCATVTLSSSTGNIAALVFDNYGTIANSWTTGTITSVNASGFVYNHYQGSITDCYAAVHMTTSGWARGFVYYGNTSVTGCFWDTTISGTSESYAGTGLSTAQMKKSSNYEGAGWDVYSTWSMCTDDVYYPRLQWTLPTAYFMCPDGVEFGDLAFFTAYWLVSGCASSNHCYQTDFNQSGTVDFTDFAVLASQWHQGI